MVVAFDSVSPPWVEGGRLRPAVIDPKQPVLAFTKSGAIMFYVGVISGRAKYIAKLKITRLNVVNT